MSILLNLLVNYYQFYDGNWDLMAKQAELCMQAIAALLIDQFPMIKKGLADFGFSQEAYLGEVVKDPEAQQPTQSLLSMFFCQDAPDPITITKEELHKRAADRIILKLAKDKKDEQSARFQFEKRVLNKIINCELREYIYWPWMSGRTLIFMKECFHYIIKEDMSVKEEVMKKFQESFDPKEMSNLFAKVAKIYSTIKKDYPSPFYLTAVEDKKNVNYPADGKSDDISAIVTIIDDDASNDQKEQEISISLFERAEEKVYEAVLDELPEFYSLVRARKTFFLI